MLVNPQGASAEPQVRDVQAAAHATGLRIHLVHASSERELEPAFAKLAELQADALLVAVDPFFDSRPDPLVALAARYRVPAIYSRPELGVAGGLISYGASIADAYRQAGIYAGRILRGETPAELPVVLPTKFELVINLKTAKALDLDIPPSLRFTPPLVRVE
jgi:putative ABC transport system substrate-binding protein